MVKSDSDLLQESSRDGAPACLKETRVITLTLRFLVALQQPQGLIEAVGCQRDGAGRLPPVQASLD